MRGSNLRRLACAGLIGVLSWTATGCNRDPVDGKVYHQDGMGPVTIDFKGGKAKLDIMGESKTLDYKVDGDKITILDKSGQNIELTRHSDGTLSGPMGTLRPS